MIDNCTLKRPVTENKVYNNCTLKLNMAYVGTSVCNCMPFMVRLGFCVTMCIELTVVVFLTITVSIIFHQIFIEEGR